MNWRSYARKLGKPTKPRVVVIKRAQYDAWARRKQRRQAMLGIASVVLFTALIGAGTVWLVFRFVLELVRVAASAR